MQYYVIVELGDCDVNACRSKQWDIMWDDDFVVFGQMTVELDDVDA